MENSPFFTNKLYKQVYDYSTKHNSYKFLSKICITLSPEKLSEYIVTLGFNTLFGILIYFSIDLFKVYPDKVPFYIIFLMIVAFSAVLGGLKSALLTTIVISLEAYFLLSASYIQLAFFIAGSMGMSGLAYLIKENSIVKKLKEQEKTYAGAFMQLHDEHAIALKDIHARDQFLSIVSHELKTPLTVMLLSLHGMKNSIQNVSLAHFSIQELMKVLENSEKQIKWLTLIINDLLDVSLITTGRISLKLEDTDLVKITKQVKQSFSELLKKGKCKIEIHAQSPVIGRWDKGRIEQAITNLVSNAIRYGEGKPIVIKIFKSGNWGKFIIQDEGIGIPHLEQKIIFELFKRASGSANYKKGLGVGLFITSQIVKIHGGNINVASYPAKGTTFTIELPLRA